MHVAGADDDVDAGLREPVGHRRVAGFAVGVVLLLKGGGGDPGCLGPLEGGHARLVRGDRGDRQAFVDEGLEVRSLPAYQDADRAPLAGPLLPAGEAGLRSGPDAAGGRIRRERRAAVPGCTVRTPPAWLLCQRRPRNARTHVSRPITVPVASCSRTTAHIPIPRLKTRRCSASSTPCSVSQS